MKLVYVTEVEKRVNANAIITQKIVEVVYEDGDYLVGNVRGIFCYIEGSAKLGRKLPNMTLAEPYSRPVFILQAFLRTTCKELF